MEQLGWKIPRHTVVPMASGSLLTKIHKSYQEAVKVGLVKRPNTVYMVHKLRVVRHQSGVQGRQDFFKPVKPDTIAKSLAIGTPAMVLCIKVFKETGGLG